MRKLFPPILAIILLLTSVSPAYAQKYQNFPTTKDQKTMQAVTNRAIAAVKADDLTFSPVYKGKVPFNLSQIEKNVVKKLSRKTLVYEYDCDGFNYTTMGKNNSITFRPYNKTTGKFEEATNFCLKQDPMMVVLYNPPHKEWKAVKAKAKKIAKNARKKSGIRAKVKYIHDYLCRHISYDSSEHYANRNDALLRGKAVCHGYAEAFSMICYYAGVNCQCVVGNAKGGAHEWNRVKIGGQWKYVDVTWDDTGKSPKYTYFLRSKKFFSKSRTITEVLEY